MSLDSESKCLGGRLLDFADPREYFVIAWAGGGGDALVARGLPSPELVRNWQGQHLEIAGFLKPLLLRKLP